MIKVVNFILLSLVLSSPIHATDRTIGKHAHEQETGQRKRQKIGPGSFDPTVNDFWRLWNQTTPKQKEDFELELCHMQDVTAPVGRTEEQKLVQKTIIYRIVDRLQPRSKRNPKQRSILEERLIEYTEYFEDEQLQRFSQHMSELTDLNKVSNKFKENFFDSSMNFTVEGKLAALYSLVLGEISVARTPANFERIVTLFELLQRNRYEICNKNPFYDEFIENVGKVGKVGQKGYRRLDVLIQNFTMAFRLGTTENIHVLATYPELRKKEQFFDFFYNFRPNIFNDANNFIRTQEMWPSVVKVAMNTLEPEISNEEIISWCEKIPAEFQESEECINLISQGNYP